MPPLFPSNPLLKTEILSSTPSLFLKIWSEAQPTPPTPQQKGGDEHYRYVCLWNYMYYLNVFLYNLCGCIVLQKNNEIKKKTSKN